MLEGFEGIEPSVDSTAFVHQGAFLVGRVEIGPQSSIWPGAVLRGDDGPITIGARTSIQDNAVCHITGGLSETVVGDQVTVGHGAILHGCLIGDDCIVGMGSIVMDNAVIAPSSIVAAGALVPPGKEYEGGKLILGNPARVVRDLTEKERAWIEHSWQVYVQLGRTYRVR